MSDVQLAAAVKPGCRQRWQQAMNHGMHSIFERLTGFVVKRPVAVIVASVAIALVLTAGLTQLQSELNVGELFTPNSSKAVDDRDWVDSVFDANSRNFNVYFTRKQGSGNLVAEGVVRDAIKEVLDTKATVLGLRAPCFRNYPCEIDPIPYRHVCLNATNVLTGQLDCVIVSIGDYFDNNAALLDSLSHAEILERLSDTNATDSFGRRLARDTMMGGIEVDANGIITSVAAFQMFGTMEAKRIPVKDERDLDPETSSVEVDLFYKVLDLNDVFTTILTAPFTFDGREDQNRGSLTDDMVLIVFGAGILVVYAMGVLYSRSWVRSRSALTFAALGSVGLAIGSSFGLVAVIGVKFNNVVMSLLVILLGLGIDDAFIIVDNYTALHEVPDMRPRLVTAMGRAGSSILATSVTDVIAFASGVGTTLPAIQAFCIYAVVGVMFDFAFQVTFFVACMHLDNVRQSRGSPDCLPCLKGWSEERSWCGLAHANDHVMQRVVGEWLPAVTLSKPGRIVVLCVTALLASFSAYGMSQLNTELSLEWFSPDDAPIQVTYDIRSEFFEVQRVVSLTTGAVDYFDLQPQLVSSVDRFKTCNGRIVPDLIADWYGNFVVFQNTIYGNQAGSRDEFYNRLLMFTESQEGEVFSESIVFVDRTRAELGLLGARTVAVMNWPRSALEQVDTMDDLRGCAEEYPDLDPRAYTFFFLFVEGNAVMKQQTLQNVLAAALSVLVVCVIILADLYAAALVFSMVALIDVNLLGFLYFSGFDYNPVTLVQIVVSIGLSIDYTLHVAHSFLTATGASREERARQAVAHVGRSVFNGGASTFVVVLPLALSEAYVYRVFFACFALTITFGLFHGLVVLPVVLSFVGPPGYTAAAPVKAGIELDMATPAPLTAT